jgi:transcriptional regulator with AAA-type ATPase domain
MTAMTETKAKTQTITLELPEGLLAALDSVDGLADRAWRALILDLLRDAELTQGQAAKLLGVTRYDILDLMASHHIPSGPRTSEEMREEIERARRFRATTAYGSG